MTTKRLAQRRSRKREQFVLGVDVGGTTIKAAIVQLANGRILQRATTPTEAVRGPRFALDQVGSLCRSVVQNGLPDGERIAAVGIAVPELVDLAGRVASGATLRWKSSDIRRSLKDLGRAVVCSDVQAAALAEARFGAGRREKVFLYVSVGTGVSSSLVIDGRPFLGAHGYAIAFASGATILKTDRTRPSLERRVGGEALFRRAFADGLEVVNGADVCRLANEAPGAARALVDDAASELALHTAILVNALDPSAVVVGGGLGSAKGRYWETFRKILPVHLYRGSGSRLRIRQAKLGPYAGVVGSACCAVEAPGD